MIFFFAVLQFFHVFLLFFLILFFILFFLLLAFLPPLSVRAFVHASSAHRSCCFFFYYFIFIFIFCLRLHAGRA
ncbi:hypothetical protein TCDM_01453 [Trypanosoma cruzi Dm28c]|uniref:Uncharacterized protein n=1 Tax=Trypanosoma cruzi Dm28c TaxID=1416333 RepID=V5DQP1_TRYCR|nr:hypothetical protein TCDM_01453 [Trypanosoma cruzi Dm28c]